MRRVAQGDRGAIADAFRGAWPPVHAFCARLLGDGPDADDAAQQAMMKLFGQAVDFDPEGDALTWALALAVWECRTIRRRRQRSRVAPLAPDAHAPGVGASPEEELLARETEHALEESLGRLAPTDREVLLGIARGAQPAGAALRKRRQRALDRLRQAWRAIHGSD